MDRPNPDLLLAELKYDEHQKTKAKLKIFFAYSAGVGKTYAMLEEAHSLLAAGVDVVIGYVEPHQRPATLALLDGLAQIAPKLIDYKGVRLSEFDIDSAIKRKPQLILVDELAHTNAKTCRHTKRYQDVEELLRMGIDVYTTVNVQHLEGLQDTVQAITGIAVAERVPDHIFDSANKVELVDIEPEDLIVRLNEGKIYSETQAKNALANFFTYENLIALREIALRRTADRVNIAVEQNKSKAHNSSYFTDEHILMCLSSSPSNAKVIRTAAKMAVAFHGTFTALFVENANFLEMSEENKIRLDKNLRLAEQLGAKIVTVTGDDVAYQVANYAKASGVSKIVLGRTVPKNIFGFSAQNYVDRLTNYAPNLEIYVIPDKLYARSKKTKALNFPQFSLSDSIKTLVCLVIATIIGTVFERLGFSEANIITIYILTSLFTAVITENKIFSLLAPLCAVLLFNFFFTEPIYTLNTYNSGYPVTFVIMFFAAFITSTYTKRVKEQAKQSSQKAYRTEVLLETSQKLQQAKDQKEIFIESLTQIRKLLDRQVLLYPVYKKSLAEAMLLDSQKESMQTYLSADEFAVASWVYANNKHAGATTNTLPGAKCLYLAIRSGDSVLAVLGVAMDKVHKLEVFEKSLLFSMLAECAMAIEKWNILEAKNEAILYANREQLHSNLLRAISHDLRTPLTAIVGGSTFLADGLEQLPTESMRSILLDIANDALWLSNLVENILNMTRIQNGHLVLAKKKELVDELVTASIAKVSKRHNAKNIEVKKPIEMIFISVDAQLLMQVLINLLDNAFNHTQQNSVIELSYKLDADKFTLVISDNGGGIPEEMLESVFDLFFTTSKIANDQQRGLGLGLSICKSIIEAHGGSISVCNNQMGGASFILTLPC